MPSDVKSIIKTINEFINNPSTSPYIEEVSIWSVVSPIITLKSSTRKVTVGPSDKVEWEELIRFLRGLILRAGFRNKPADEVYRALIDYPPGEVVEGLRRVRDYYPYFPPVIGFKVLDRVLGIKEAIDFLTSNITYEGYLWGMLRGVFDYLRGHEYLNKASIEWWRYIEIGIPGLDEFYLYEEVKVLVYHHEGS